MSSSKAQREFDNRMRSNTPFHGMWEEGMCSMRDSHKWMDTPIPPRVLFTLDEMSEKLLNSPHYMWARVAKQNESLKTTGLQTDTSSRDSLVPQYDSSDSDYQETSESEGPDTQDSSFYWASKNLGGDRSDDDDPESRFSGRSSGSATVELEMGRVQERRPDSPFLLAIGLTRVKEEPDTDIKIILHTSRQPPPARPTPQNVRRGIQAYVEELLFLFGFGMVMTFLCVLLYIYIEVFCVTPTQPAPPLDFILPYTE
jgi:hypothetical protein